MIRDAEELLLAQVKVTVAALPNVTDADAAVIKLAEKYALLIDACEADEDPKIQAWAVRWIGPLLLDCLTQLGATPASRGVKNDVPALGSNRLAELRASRR